MRALAVTAEAFVEMAHRIVWATVATVDDRKPTTQPDPPPGVAMGWLVAGGMDRHQPYTDQARSPLAEHLRVSHLLD